MLVDIGPMLAQLEGKLVSKHFFAQEMATKVKTTSVSKHSPRAGSRERQTNQPQGKHICATLHPTHPERGGGEFNLPGWHFTRLESKVPRAGPALRTTHLRQQA